MATAAVQQTTVSQMAHISSSAAATAWLAYIRRTTHEGVLLPTAEEASALSSEGHAEMLASYVYTTVEAALRTQHIQAFWARLQACNTSQPAALEAGLLQALQALSSAVQAQSTLLQQLARMLLALLVPECRPSAVAAVVGLVGRHKTAVSAVLISGAPFSLTGLLHQYYEHKLTQLSASLRRQQQAPGGGGDGGSSDGEQQEEQDVEMADQENAPPGTMDARSSPARVADLGPEWSERLQTVAGCLRQLGLEAASEEAYTMVVNRHVAEQLHTMARKVFDRRVLPAAQSYVASAPFEFLKLLVGREERDAAVLRLNEWRLRLTYFMLETLGHLRIADMFDIIVDYPDSAPAVADVAECLQHTNLHAAFIREVRESVGARLLHAGAATSDIITSYVSAIKALREIDPSGLLLDAVASPIRLYLRGRPDTIRCIVAMLTEDTGDSLLEELEGGSGPGGGSGHNAQGSGLGGGLSEAEGDEAALRMLEAMAAAPAGAATLEAAAPAAGRPELDIVAMLIGIYGSKELFISEYRLSLAQRLLAKVDYDVAREVRTLELLKIRFGEASLHNCEVMIKDLTDSKRLNHTIRNLAAATTATPALSPTSMAAVQAAVAEAVAAFQVTEGASAAASANMAAAVRVAQATAAAAGAAIAGQGDGVPNTPEAAANGALQRLHATVASYLFWPELQEHEMQLPPDMAQALELYAERYHHVKAPRKLLWRPTLGLVELEVQIGASDPLEFSVTPVHAAILLHFGAPAGPAAASGSSGGAGGVASASAGALAAALGVPQAVIRRKALFWVNNGVLLESRGPGGEVVYRRAESLDPSRALVMEATDMSWQADAGAAASSEEKLAAEMGPFENFIVGILTNFSAVPLDRMHSLLRMFVVGEPKYDKSQEQLGAFLQVMAARGKVEIENGIYKKKLAS